MCAIFPKDRHVLEDYAASVSVRGMMYANDGMNSSSGSGSSSSGGGVWRPLCRPQWYSVTREAQNNTSLLMREHRIQPLTSEELTTVMAPLKAKILQRQQNIGVN